MILVATALRLVVAACFGPGNDEAYHDLFAQHLDWSYFDHPPMLALVESAGLALVGFHASVFALRLGIVILFAGSTWLLARMTARHYGSAAGWIAAFALNATAYYGVAAATFALPDGPLVFFWLLTLDRLLVVLEEPERVGPWAAVGLAWGGAMLSKYQAVFLPVATLAYLAFEPAARHWLRRPGPYLAFALGLLVFAPVISWNAHHGWASFAFQGGRALGWPVIRPDRFAAFLGGQAAYLFPWLWVPLIVVLFREARGQRGRKGEDIPGRFLLYQAVVPLLAFGGVALVQPVLPHWSLVGFLAAFPLLGRAWAQRREAAPARFIVRLSVLGIPHGRADRAGGDPGGNRLPPAGRAIRPGAGPGGERPDPRFLRLGPGQPRAREARAPRSAGALPVHRSVVLQRTPGVRDRSPDPGGLLQPQPRPELRLLERPPRLGRPRRNLRRNQRL